MPTALVNVEKGKVPHTSSEARTLLACALRAEMARCFAAHGWGACFE